MISALKSRQAVNYEVFLPQSFKAQGLIQSSNYGLCAVSSSHVSPVAVRVSTGYSGFRPTPKNISISDLATQKLPLVSVGMCVLSSFAASVVRTVSGSIITLTRRKWLLKMDEQINAFLSLRMFGRIHNFASMAHYSTSFSFLSKHALHALGVPSMSNPITCTLVVLVV